MKVGLIDVDNIGRRASFPSLPLMKISAYHKARGDQVEWWLPMAGRYDMVYQSKVFTFTPELQYGVQADRHVKGGTGYGMGDALPNEIEHAMPDYGLYGNRFADTAYGFLTRGCPRQCAFCIVSAKEGRVSRQVAELSEFWNGQRNVKLLDPNLLACAEREPLLRELADSGAWVDFTQGLDIRLTDKDAARMLAALKVRQLHFTGAWKCDHCGRYHCALVARYEFVGIASMDCCAKGLWDMAENIASEYEDLRAEEVAQDLMRNQVGYVERAGRDITSKRQKSIQRAETGGTRKPIRA